jgi:hypothetical protein
MPPTGNCARRLFQPQEYVWQAQGMLSSSDVLVQDAFSSWKMQLLRSVAWTTCCEIRCCCLPSYASISTKGTCMMFTLLAIGESMVIAASGSETKNQAVQQKEIILVRTKLCASGPRLKALAWSLPQCRQQATAPGACSSHRNMFGKRRECSAVRMCWCWMLSAAGRCSY